MNELDAGDELWKKKNRRRKDGNGHQRKRKKQHRKTATGKLINLRLIETLILIGWHYI